VAGAAAGASAEDPRGGDPQPQERAWASNRALSPSLTCPGRAVRSARCRSRRARWWTSPRNERESPNAKVPRRDQQRGEEGDPGRRADRGLQPRHREDDRQPRGDAGGQGPRSGPLARSRGRARAGSLTDNNGFRPPPQPADAGGDGGREETHPRRRTAPGSRAESARNIHSGGGGEGSGGAPNDDLSTSRRRGHLPQHPRVQVRELLQPGEASGLGALGSLAKLRAKDPRAAQTRSPTRHHPSVYAQARRIDSRHLRQPELWPRLLDRNRIQAFEKAQPFANPSARVVENGVIRFAFASS